jgi:hypothetical protein
MIGGIVETALPLPASLAPARASRDAALRLAMGLPGGGTVLGALWAAVIAIVLLRGMLRRLPAPVAAAARPASARVGTIARMAAWRDLAVGSGALFARMLPAGFCNVDAPAVLGGSRWRHAR